MDVLTVTREEMARVIAKFLSQCQLSSICSMMLLEEKVQELGRGGKLWPYKGVWKKK